MVFAIIGGIILLYFLIMFVLFTVSFTNIDKSPTLPVKNPAYAARCKESYDEFDSFEKEDVYIESFDHYKLHGYFMKNEKTDKVVISFHGYNTEARKEYPLHYSYYRDGYTVLIVDQRGVGQAEGKFITMGLLERHDCLKWIDYVVERYNGNVEILLDGLSMGASTIMMAAQDIKQPQVKGMIVNCGFDSCEEELLYVMKHNMKLPKYPFLWTLRFYAKVFAKYDMNEITAHESLTNCDIPLLMIHGTKDTFVPYENLHKIYPHAKAENKKMVSVEEAAHGISCFVNRELFESEIQQFMININF